MKRLIISIFAICISAQCGTISNPQIHEIDRRIEAGDTLSKMSFDINGDGIIDPFFTVEQSNPDPIDIQASSQEGGTSSWDAYVSKPGTSLFTVGDTLEVQGGSGLHQGTALTLRTNEMFVGKISEIQKFGIVTSIIKRAKTENSKIIYAYSWEVDHFKQWKLAEFLVDSPNAIFDKYLAEDKRTQIQIQEVYADLQFHITGTQSASAKPYISNQKGFLLYLIDSKKPDQLISGLLTVPDSFGEIEAAVLTVIDVNGKKILTSVLGAQILEKGSKVFEFSLDQSLLKNSIIQISHRDGDNLTVGRIIIGSFGVKNTAKQNAVAH